ncbi:hypothetical protein L596_030916 [Steinernema carpocapsae]|uniref:FLYWCH-type domain-containing protein n=1 Tax=Steinernema carpocapsae TaxID=34508 RepID=A0A4U5MHA6_STECR|nr:hypothetical protein L596_030916 [Steinernema carpocapsae]
MSAESVASVSSISTISASIENVANPTDPIQFTEASSQRNRTSDRVGHGVMMADGFSYRRQRPLKTHPGYTTYRCINKNCNARARINDATHRGELLGNHIHNPDYASEQKRLSKDHRELQARTVALLTGQPSVVRSKPVRSVRSPKAENQMAQNSDRIKAEAYFKRRTPADNILFTEASSQRNRISGLVGHGVMMANGFAYRYQRPLKTHTEYTAYRCIKKDCSARARINDVNCLGEVIAAHNHEPDFESEQKRLTKDQQELQARTVALLAENKTASQDVVRSTRFLQTSLEESSKVINGALKPDDSFLAFIKREVLFEQSIPLKFIEASSQRNRTSDRVGHGVMMADGYSYRCERPLKTHPGFTSYRCVKKDCSARARINDTTHEGKRQVSIIMAQIQPRNR